MTSPDETAAEVLAPVPEPRQGTYYEVALLRRFIAGGPVDLAEVRAQVGALLAEVDETRALFDMQWTRMRRATELWRAESLDERALVAPDLGALLDWLMEQAGAAAIERVRALHEEYEGRCVVCLEPCLCIENAEDSVGSIYEAWSNCAHGNAEYPCPTIRAVNGQGATSV